MVLRQGIWRVATRKDVFVAALVLKPFRKPCFLVVVNKTSLCRQQKSCNKRVQSWRWQLLVIRAGSCCIYILQIFLYIARTSRTSFRMLQLLFLLLVPRVPLRVADRIWASMLWFIQTISLRSTRTKIRKGHDLEFYRNHTASAKDATLHRAIPLTLLFQQSLAVKGNFV